MGRDACSGKVANIRISPNPVRAGPTLGGVVTIVIAPSRNNSNASHFIHILH